MTKLAEELATPVFTATIETDMQAEPAAVAGLAARLMKEADNMQYNDDLGSMDDGIKLMREAAAALSPAHAGVQAVPVAWQWRYKHINESAIWSEWGSYDPALSSYSDYVEEKRPLYAAPASPVGEER